jgi:hypothetical protein
MHVEPHQLGEAEAGGERGVGGVAAAGVARVTVTATSFVSESAPPVPELPRSLTVTSIFATPTGAAPGKFVAGLKLSVASAAFSFASVPLEGSAASATRPCGSSTRTALALQGRDRRGDSSSTCWNRGSRTVKYCTPVSKVPNGESTLAMRPPAAALFSNTVTSWPACARVRAQARPAMPAPTTAILRGDVSGLVFLGMLRFIVACGAGRATPCAWRSAK